MRRLLQTLSLALLLAVLLLTAARQVQAARATPPIAYISMQRVLNETSVAKMAAVHLQEAQQQRTADVKTKQQALENTRQQLAQAGGVFKASTRAELQKKEQQQRTELEHAAAQAQTELQALQRQAQADIVMKLHTVLSEMAKRDSTQLVLNQDTAVIWSVPGSDVTAEVIERLNAVAAPPAAKSKP